VSRRQEMKEKELVWLRGRRAVVNTVMNTEVA
jgi:hypothetical protein